MPSLGATSTAVTQPTTSATAHATLTDTDVLGGTIAIAVGSELGTLAVLARDGAVVAEKDLGALPVPAWLPGGDQLAVERAGILRRHAGFLGERAAHGFV